MNKMNKMYKPAFFIAVADAEPDSHHASLADHLYAECQGIYDLLEDHQRSQRLEIVQDLQVSKHEIDEKFHDDSRCITVFHFAGHADGESIYLRESKASRATFPISNLADFFAKQPYLQLVFLNACCTGEDMEMLRKAKIPILITTTDAVDNEAAKSFAISFYRALLNGRTVGDAFDTAAAVAPDRRNSSEQTMWQLDPDNEEVRARTFWEHICRLPDTKNAAAFSQASASIAAATAYGKLQPSNAITPPPKDATRSRAVAEIVQLILTLERRGMVLYGDQNIGKTVLARRVLCDSGLQNPEGGFPYRFEVAFDAHVTDLPSLLRRLLEQCRTDSGGRVNADHIDDRQLAGELDAALDGNRCVLLARNIHEWQRKLLAQLQQELESVFVLATAPVPGVATSLATELKYHLFEVGPPSEEDAVNLLIETLVKDSRHAALAHWAEPAHAAEIVQVVGCEPARVLHTARTMLARAEEQIDWKLEFKAMPPLAVGAEFSRDDLKVVALYVAELSVEQKVEFCKLFTYAPASLRATDDQRSLISIGMSIGALKSIGGGRYRIVESYHRYAGELARELLSEREYAAVQQRHAEQYARAAAAVFGRGVQDLYDFAEFDADWLNIDRGWQWAMQQRGTGEMQPEIDDLLIKFAACTFFVHPFPLPPQETLRRIRVALPQRTYSEAHRDIGHLWICLATAHLDVADAQRTTGDSRGAAENVRAAQQQLQELQRTFTEASVERCATYVALGDVASQDKSDQLTAEDVASPYYMKAKALAKRLRQRHYKCRAHLGDALAIAASGEPRRAIGQIAHALEIAIGIKDTRTIMALLIGLADSLDKLAALLAATNSADPDISGMKIMAQACRSQAERLRYSLA